MSAQPLTAGRFVVAATLTNSLYALDRETGCVAWRVNLGPPVRRDQMQCGVLRTEGIVGTPVIDPTRRRVYAVYYTGKRHFLVAVNLDQGRVLFRQPADPAGSDPAFQLQRGALLQHPDGRVLVSLGGRAGDCGDYHGYLAAFTPEGIAAEVFQVTPNRAGALWNPAGPALLPGGDVLVTSGNSDLPTEADRDLGQSVIRLSPRLVERSHFTDPDFARLDQLDLDLGSVGPTPVAGGKVFQVGKAGTAYLVNADDLGNGVVSRDLGGCYAIGGTAYRDPMVYVPCDHGLMAVRVSGGRLAIAWQGPDFRAGSPILSGGVIWDYDFEGAALWALDPSSGRVVARQSVDVAQHFVSAAAGYGRLFLPAGSEVIAYRTD